MNADSEDNIFSPHLANISHALQDDNEIKMEYFREIIHLYQSKQNILSEWKPTLQQLSSQMMMILKQKELSIECQLVISVAYSMTVYRAETTENASKHLVNLLQPVGNNETRTSDQFRICLAHGILQLSNFKAELIVETIFPVVRRLCFEYGILCLISFKVLVGLLSKIHLAKEPNSSLCATPNIFKDILNIVMSNWENPITGVRQQNFFVFEKLLLFDEEIWNFVLPSSLVYASVLRDSIRFQCLLELILSQQPWTMKSKYFLLAALLPKCGTMDEVLHNYGTDIVPGLLSSLKFSHLVSAGTDLYRVILGNLPVNQWKHFFWASTVRILVQESYSLQLENMFNYWLPLTFKPHPILLPDLLEKVGTSNLFSTVSLLKLSRKEGFDLPCLENINTPEVQNGLRTSSDKIRAQTFALVCTSTKTSTVPTEEEFNLVRQFLKHNVNSDNTALRQNILSSFTNFIVRLKDSVLNIIKSKRSETENSGLMNCSSFLNWLHLFFISNLEEGCNYQRKFTSLELYKIVLTYFGTHYDKNNYSRKSNQRHFRRDECTIFGNWSYESDESRRVLLHCVFHQANDIRLSAAGILMTHFRISECHCGDHEDLFWKAVAMCSNQMFYQAESGALTIQVIVTVAQNSSVVGFKEKICNGRKSFISLLLSSAEQQLLNLTEDLLKAASRGSPLHGVLHALERLLTEPSSPEYMLLDETEMEQLISLLESTTSTLLAILSSKSDPKSDYAPSFGEMGMAIAAAVEGSLLKAEEFEASSTSGEDQEDFNLTPAQQLVLNCIWLNLRVCSSLCSKLVNKPLNSVDTSRCVTLLCNILRKCRHKGAIECAGLALCRVTMYLTASLEPTIVEIPQQLLSQFIESLVDATSTTISRRSAGLAILVHRIVSGDVRPYKPLLHMCVTKLVSVVQHTELSTGETFSDLPQTQALHFLRMLVQDSGLRQQMAQYTLQISLLSIINLASPLWTIRNAALQLFGALVPKLIGQKRQQDESKGGSYHLACEELYNHTLPLCEMMQEEFKMATASNCLQLHSKLMPLLTLVTNLTVSLQTVIDTSQATVFNEFNNSFIKLFKSDIFNVRELSAKASAWFCLPDKIVPLLESRVEEVLNYLSTSRSSIKTENELHGYLFNIKYLVERYDEEKCGMMILLDHSDRVQTVLNNLCDAVVQSQTSFMSKSLVLDFHFINTQGSLISGVNLIKSMDDNEMSLGFPNYVCEHLKALIFHFDLNDDIRNILEYCLMKNSNFDVHRACLEGFKLRLEKPTPEMTNFGNCLSLLNDFVHITRQHTEVLVLVLEIMLIILETVTENSVVFNVDTLYIDLLQSSNKVSSLSLPVVCGILSKQEEVNCSLVCKCVTYIKDKSSPLFDQDVRFYSARALSFVACFLSTQNVDERNEIGSCIWEAVVCFLQDEIPEIRSQASKFVTLYVAKREDIIWNPYISLEYMFEYFSITSFMSPQFAVNYLYRKLKCDLCESKFGVQILNPFDHGSRSLYEEETKTIDLVYHSLIKLLSKHSTLKIDDEAIFNDSNYTINLSLLSSGSVSISGIDYKKLKYQTEIISKLKGADFDVSDRLYCLSLGK